jgi:hypothetical protein
MDGTQSLSKLPNHTGRPFPLGGLFFRHVRHSSAGASGAAELRHVAQADKENPGGGAIGVPIGTGRRRPAPR